MTTQTVVTAAIATSTRSICASVRQAARSTRPIAGGDDDRAQHRGRQVLHRPGQEQQDARRSSPAANRPEIWVRAPSESLTAVREPLAPIENACVSPAAAFAAPIASSSCDARTGSWRRPANERAVRISSANETRNTPSAAGASSATSPSPGRGSVGRGRPLGIRPDDRDAVAGQVERPGGADRADDDDQRAGDARDEEAKREQHRQRHGADRHRRAADLAELARRSRPAGERVAGADREAEQLAELADHEHDRDAVDVADQHRPREVVGEPAEPQQAREQEAGADEQREHRRELDRVRAAGDRERQHRGRDERRDRPSGPTTS